MVNNNTKSLHGGNFMYFRRRIWVLSSAIFIISALSFYILYMHLFSLEGIKEPNPEHIVEQYVNRPQRSNPIKLKPSIKNLKDIPVSEGKTPKVSASTEMVYQYYYETEGQFIEESALPPYFLIGLTKEELVQKYSDWQIHSFTPERIVMSKSIRMEEPNNYVLGVDHGYIAIFYNNSSGETQLKETTETPITSLPQGEQEKLQRGIEVFGEDQLIRILEDYTS